MGITKDAIMRMLVFFDLPTKSREEKKAAAKFRAFLIADGFEMVQWSVYMRVCKGESAVTKHRIRIHAEVPLRGHIRILHITELQYTRMDILGNMPKKSTDYKVEQLTLL